MKEMLDKIIYTVVLALPIIGAVIYQIFDYLAKGDRWGGWKNTTDDQYDIALQELSESLMPQKDVFDTLHNLEVKTLDASNLKATTLTFCDYENQPIKQELKTDGPLTCKNCGAPINRETMTCEYCGTQYEVKT